MCDFLKRWREFFIRFLAVYNIVLRRSTLNKTSRRGGKTKNEREKTEREERKEMRKRDRRRHRE